MPVLKMAESGDHQRQFQAAVDVIQNLPKNGEASEKAIVLMSIDEYAAKLIFGSSCPKFACDDDGL